MVYLVGFNDNVFIIGSRFLLLPITLAGELPKVPADLLGKVSMVFYSSLDDMLIKALNIAQD